MMSSFLSKQRTNVDYLEKISNEPTGTQRNKLGSIRNFERFVVTNYDGRSVEEVLEELSILKDMERERALYDMLQDWINWNHKEGKNNSTVRTTFSYLRQYLYYRGIKTNPQDIKENLKFGKKLENERHLENWIKIIKVLYPNSYEKRIKRDFNYWRDYRDKGKSSPHGEWYVPKDFAWYWHFMKYGAYFSIIIGFFLQIYQLGFL